jgi:hypothetical protein
MSRPATEEDSMKFKMNPPIPYDLLFEFLEPERVEIKKMFGHHCLGGITGIEAFGNLRS